MLFTFIVLTMAASWCSAVMALVSVWRSKPVRACEPSVLSPEEKARLLALVPGKLEMRERGAAALRGGRQ